MREKNKKIMKTKQQRRYKCSCPMIKSIEEKRLELLQHSLAVLKKILSFISFQRYHKIQENIIFHVAALQVLSIDHQQANNSKCTTPTQKGIFFNNSKTVWNPKIYFLNNPSSPTPMLKSNKKEKKEFRLYSIIL
jgi:hypothetical protein